MLSRLRKQIALERKMLDQLIQDHRPLIEKARMSVPDRFEISALAVMVNAFYTGTENIFRRILVELNEPLPGGKAWHRSLLDRMTDPGPGRPQVISSSLAETLSEYLGFRHFFRSAYPSLTAWERMSDLVIDCETTLRALEAELDSFLAQLPE